jgi:hypothetical protein
MKPPAAPAPSIASISASTEFAVDVEFVAAACFCFLGGRFCLCSCRSQRQRLVGAFAFEFAFELVGALLAAPVFEFCSGRSRFVGPGSPCCWFAIGRHAIHGFVQKVSRAGKTFQLTRNSISRFLFFTSANIKILHCGNPVNCLWRARPLPAQFSLATSVTFRQNPASRL